MIEFSRLKAISLLSLVIAGLAVAVSLLNSHHPIDVSDLWPVLLRWALATKTYILLLSSHTIAFLLGGLFFLLAALIGTVIYITWLPYYFFPLKKTAVDRSRSSNPPLSRTRKQSLRDDSDADPQLFKKGWIRFSLYIQDQADPSFLEPFDTPTYLQQSQDESLMPPDSQIFTRNIGNHVHSLFEAGSFLYSKFTGDSHVNLPNPSQSEPEKKTQRQWKNLYAKLHLRDLTFYSSNTKEDVIHTLFLPDFDVSLECSSADLFYRNEPIVLTHKATKHDIFLYCPTASDKEDWFFVIQRASRLPEFADDAAAAAFHRDLEPVKAFDQGLQKLIYTLNTESEKSPNTPIWLNALLGRAFIGIRSNPQIKAWIMETITLRMAHVQRNSSSILGDIVIKDLDVGDSLPILSNPKLVSLTPEGTITMELDVDYTGGISLDAATVASISVNAWTQYMKPITVPIIVRITITRFFARMLVKMKPFWESDRVWFGFYRHPEVVLELKVEPVISSKLVQSDLVNSVIEKRIKEALEEFLILPNMDALVFWPFPDEIWMEEGAGADGTQDALSQDLDDSPRPMSLSLSEQGFESHQKSLRKAQSQKLVLNKAGLQREFKFTQWIKSLRAAEHDGARDLSSKEAQDDSDSLTSSSPVKSAPLETQILTVAGDTAFKVGQIVRTYGIDSTARSVARKVSSNLSILAGPAVEFIDDKTRAYRDKVYNDSVQLGLGIVDSLGLKPSPQDSFASLPPLLTQVGQLETGSESDREFVSSRLSASSPSKVLDILGVSISTSAPPVLNEGGSSSMRRKKAVTRTRSNMSMVSDQAGTGGDSEERRSLVAQWEKAVGRS